MRGLKPPKWGNDPLPEGGGDPWAAFGYLVAGVGVYGLLGWGLSVWLDASYWIPVGILVGAALGLVLVYYQFRIKPTPDENHSSDSPDSLKNQSTTPAPDATESGASSDDRGVTE